MVPFQMTLSDLWPRFQRHDILQRQKLKKRYGAICTAKKHRPQNKTAYATNKNLAIANRSPVEGICRPLSRDLEIYVKRHSRSLEREPLDRSLYDVEYYGDLEMWVISHSRSLKVVAFESLGTVSYSPSIATVTA